MKKSKFAIGLPLGIAIGVAIGVSQDNLALGIGVALSSKKK